MRSGLQLPHRFRLLQLLLVWMSCSFTRREVISLGSGCTGLCSHVKESDFGFLTHHSKIIVSQFVTCEDYICKAHYNNLISRPKNIGCIGCEKKGLTAGRENKMTATLILKFPGSTEYDLICKEKAVKTQGSPAAVPVPDLPSPSTPSGPPCLAPQFTTPLNKISSIVFWRELWQTQPRAARNRTADASSFVLLPPRPASVLLPSPSSFVLLLPSFVTLPSSIFLLRSSFFVLLPSSFSLEGRRTKEKEKGRDEGRRKKDEGRSKKEEGRGRRTKEKGRTTNSSLRFISLGFALICW